MSNGNSYQKFDGASGIYQEIPNGADGGSKKKKWLLALVVLLAGAGVAYGLCAIRNNPQDNVNKALAKDSNVQVKANGKLKLFDDLSEYKAIRWLLYVLWFCLFGILLKCSGSAASSHSRL